MEAEERIKIVEARLKEEDAMREKAEAKTKMIARMKLEEPEETEKLFALSAELEEEEKKIRDTHTEIL